MISPGVLYDHPVWPGIIDLGLGLECAAAPVLCAIILVGSDKASVYLRRSLFVVSPRFFVVVVAVFLPLSRHFFFLPLSWVFLSRDFVV